MLKKCIKIGLTGGIATGKSIVAGILKKQGALVIEADTISRSVVQPGSAVLKQIKTAFGDGVICSDGTLNRKKLADTVFGNTAKRDLLNSILHPLIIDTLIKKIEAFEASGQHHLIVADIPLLFECGLQNRFDIVLVITADKETRINRIMKRDAVSRKQAEQRIEAQMPCSQKTRLADYVIDNSAARDELEQKTLETLYKILK